MVPTWAISFLPAVGVESRFSSSTIASTAWSMPRFSSIGLAPAVTFLRPSRKIAWASTVAVVVPSPARSEVLVATSFTIWAPMFSIGSASSISLATVTPSLVTVGRAELLVDDDVPALGAEGHLDRVGEGVHALLELGAGVGVEHQFLRSHDVFSLGHAVGRMPLTISRVLVTCDPEPGPAPPHSGVARSAQPILARMSDALMMTTSSPSRVMLVPLYLP